MKSKFESKDKYTSHYDIVEEELRSTTVGRNYIILLTGNTTLTTPIQD